MSPFCRVLGCRYADSHVTSAHRCGTCGVLGHGQLECADHALTRALASHLSDEMPAHLRCTVRGCTHPQTHATSAHHCSLCMSRGGTHYPWCALADDADTLDDTDDEASDPPNTLTLSRQCPFCRAHSDVAAEDPMSVFVSQEECAVCLQHVPKLVVLASCGHLVCAACVQKM